MDYPTKTEMPRKVELPFLERENARKQEFRSIWENELQAVFSDVAVYYERANNVASLGMCDRWRDRFISTIDVKPGQRVLDVCAGTNSVGIKLLQKQPDLDITAIDRSKAMQEVGRSLAEMRGFRIESVIGDAHNMPFPDDYFDVVTLQWASRHLRVVEAFSEIGRVLKPGGRFYHCDMLRPGNKIVEELYCRYLKLCVSVTAVIFHSCPEAWRCRDYFVRGIRLFYSPEEISELLTRLGFANVSGASLLGGMIAFHKASKL